MNRNTRTILVTGAAGYIGSVLVPELLAQDFSVIAVDGFIYGQNSLLDCCHNERLSIIRGDVRDTALMQKVVKKADLIVPLACLVGAPICERKPDEARAVNLDAVRKLVELSGPDQPIVMPTTNSGYGIGEEGMLCTESSPMRPVSLYGRLKVELEDHVLASGRAISLRLATAFGISPRMRLDLLVNDFTYRAVNDRFVVLFEAHFKRNYIHVRDIARAFIHSIRNYETMKNQAYNVGLSDANLSKLELCEEIRKQVPDFTILESPIGKDPDQRNYIVSNERIEKTGYHPSVSLSKGIAELIKGYQVVYRNNFTNL